MTIWKPDTCKCVLHVETETIIKKCKIHNNYYDARILNQDINLTQNITDKQLAKKKYDKWRTT